MVDLSGYMQSMKQELLGAIGTLGARIDALDGKVEGLRLDLGARVDALDGTVREIDRKLQDLCDKLLAEDGEPLRLGGRR